MYVTLSARSTGSSADSDSLLQMLKDKTIRLGCTIAVRKYGFRPVLEGDKVCDMLVIAAATLVRGPDMPVCDLSSEFAALTVENEPSAGGGKPPAEGSTERKALKAQEGEILGPSAAAQTVARSTMGKPPLPSTTKPLMPTLPSTDDHGRTRFTRSTAASHGKAAENTAEEGASSDIKGTIAAQMMERVRRFGRSKPANTAEVSALKPASTYSVGGAAMQPTAILPRKR